MKPTFLIIGTMKSGTTSAMAYFNQHPSIYISWAELHFFDKNENYKKGIKWYENHFKEKRQQIGEKTPIYSFSRVALQRIKKHYPDIKLILFLRDPVYRAYSQYNHMLQATIRKGKDSPYYHNLELSFLDLVKADEKKKNFRFHKTIFQKGCYIDQIEYILKLFPRNQLKIVIFEHYVKDYLKQNNELFKFLGVSSVKKLIVKKEHVRKHERKITKEEIAYLKKKYKPYNERLFKFLGYRIKEWV